MPEVLSRLILRNNQKSLSRVSSEPPPRIRAFRNLGFLAAPWTYTLREALRQIQITAFKPAIQVILAGANC